MVSILKFLILVLFLMLSVAFFTLLERKVLGLIGLRLGPSKVSFLGIMQPVMDAVKLMNKQVNVLSNFSIFFYYFNSFFLIFFSIYIWSSLMVDPMSFSLTNNFLLLFIYMGLNSFNSIICGWSIFGKYSLIGSLRTVSQLISYESVLYLCLFFLFLFYSSFNFHFFFFYPFNFFFFFLPACFYIWIPSILAELNRTPFDFSEGESELVSGFNTEFGSSCFTLIFLSEYSLIVFFMTLTSLFFFFYMSIFFSLSLFFFVVWIRSVVPRFRFDKLMMISWKFFIPFLTLIFVFYCYCLFL